MRKILLILAVFTCVMASAQCKTDIDLGIISRIESNHDPKAFNEASPSTTADDSYGQYQITRICLRGYNQAVGTSWTVDDLYDPKINKDIATWALYVEIPRLLKKYGFQITIRNKIICYNAGIRYLVKHQPLPKITQDYIKKYDRICQELNNH
jgi:hypothetical protein